MTRILAITHGRLAEELILIAEKALDKKSSVVPICFSPDSNLDSFQYMLAETMQHFQPQDQVLILTDLFGGTPSNLSITYIEKDRVEVVTGLNLAMLLYVISQSDNKKFAELCTGVKKAGRDAVVIAGEFLA